MEGLAARLVVVTVRPRFRLIWMLSRWAADVVCDVSDDATYPTCQASPVVLLSGRMLYWSGHNVSSSSFPPPLYDVALFL